MKYTHAAVVALASKALAAPRTVAPTGCSTVSATGGDFATIQEAVNNVTDGGCIFLDQGVYAGQVLLNNTQDVSIYGYTTDDASYLGNAATITAGRSQDDADNNDETGTLRIHGNNFKLYNVNVENTRGSGSQAIAISAQNSSAYYGCGIHGYQDTLLSNYGQQLYVNSEITGSVDFIFGQKAYSWFENVDIRVLAFTKVNQSTGYVTADGPPTEAASRYVFNNCDIAAKEGEAVIPGSYTLGRPWRPYAEVIFQNTSMSNVINSTGWSIWGKTDPRLDNITFGEYANFGEGAAGPRANFTTLLTEPIDITSVLGSDYTAAGWYDASYM